MCKYEIRIDLNYGNMNMPVGDNYNMAVEKFKKIKDDFANTPAKIILWNNERNIEQFVSKVDNRYDFKKHYNELINILVKINELGKELVNTEKELSEKKTESYHNIELTDYDNLSIGMLIELKKDLTIRRVTKECTKEYYAFHELNCKLIELLKNYKNVRHSKLLDSCSKTYYSKFYKESEKNKDKRISILNDLKIS